MNNRIRKEIETMIKNNDLQALLYKSGELHGHLCNYLSYGIIAGTYALKKLGVNNTGMEEIIAITETNNCFSDGIQMVTGCTFGNNALIFRDFGKTAVTISKRNGNAIRLVLKPDFENSREEQYPEVHNLFYKLVARRKSGSPEEYEKMTQLFSEMSLNEIKISTTEMFNIYEIEINLPEYAPIFENIRCEKCGENVIKSKIIEKDGQKLCVSCANASYLELNGNGISK
jgi:formylmethanofuran dehydrogenase subunit E